MMMKVKPKKLTQGHTNNQYNQTLFHVKKLNLKIEKKRENQKEKKKKVQFSSPEPPKINPSNLSSPCQIIP